MCSIRVDCYLASCNYKVKNISIEYKLCTLNFGIAIREYFIYVKLRVYFLGMAERKYKEGYAVMGLNSLLYKTTPNEFGVIIY